MMLWLLWACSTHTAPAVALPKPPPSLTWSKHGDWLVVGQQWWQDHKLQPLPDGLDNVLVVMTPADGLWLDDEGRWARWAPGKSVQTGQFARPADSVPLALAADVLHLTALADDAEAQCLTVMLSTGETTAASCYPMDLPRVTDVRRATDGRMAITTSSESAALRFVRWAPEGAASPWPVPPVPGTHPTSTPDVAVGDSVFASHSCARSHTCLYELVDSRWVERARHRCEAHAVSPRGQLACWKSDSLCVTKADTPKRCVPATAP
jgi:hypothetical protein